MFISRVGVKTLNDRRSDILTFWRFFRDNSRNTEATSTSKTLQERLSSDLSDKPKKGMFAFANLTKN